LWKLDKYIADQVNSWYKYHSTNGLLKFEGSIIKLTLPFSFEITEEVYEDIANIYPKNVEKGGLIYCRVKSFSPAILETVYVKEIPNVMPIEERKHSYRPDREEYIKSLNDNFSKHNSEILIPIHFHTHPTEDHQQSVEYSNSFLQLDTSEPDRNAARNRHIAFNEIKLSYFSAIITGHDKGHNILFYCDGVTPLDFFDTKFNRIQKSLSKLGDEAATLTDDKDLQKVVKAGVELIGAIVIGFNRWSIDYIPLLLSEKEYFGSLNRSGITSIKIPKENVL
jgi:hypothetical protein